MRRLDDPPPEGPWRLYRGYALLTLAIFGPLMWSFATVSNYYPMPVVWSLFSTAVDPSEGRTYRVLRGETAAGETIDVSPIRITDGLSGRNHSLVNNVINNKSFKLASPHPENVALAIEVGTPLPRALRIRQLLRSWGEGYNDRLAAGSPRRLRSIRLDEYEWPGGRYADYEIYRGSWEVELPPGGEVGP